MAVPTGDKSEDKKEEILPTDLSDVHDQTLRELEENPDLEDEEAGDDKEEIDAGGDKDEAEPKGDDSGAGDDGGDEDNDEPVKPTAPEVPTPKAPEPAAELDTDITKPGDTKVEVKDFDGKSFYFNNLDEIPDDFEPASYKVFAKAVSNLTIKSQQDAQRQASEAEEYERTQTEERMQAIRAGWEKDINSLVDEKLLPKDEKERQDITDQVFHYMNSQLEKGRVLDFEPAFKAWSYEQERDERAGRVKKEQAEKKQRGARVVGAGSGSGATPNRSASQGRTIEAPPTGLSLDDIHSSVLGSL